MPYVDRLGHYWYWIQKDTGKSEKSCQMITFTIWGLFKRIQLEIDPKNFFQQLLSQEGGYCYVHRCHGEGNGPEAS